MKKNVAHKLRMFYCELA